MFFPPTSYLFLPSVVLLTDLGDSTICTGSKQGVTPYFIIAYLCLLGLCDLSIITDKGSTVNSELTGHVGIE